MEREKKSVKDRFESMLELTDREILPAAILTASMEIPEGMLEVLGNSIVRRLQSIDTVADRLEAAAEKFKNGLDRLPPVWVAGGRDEAKLLDDILASTIRIALREDDIHTFYSDRPVSWLLQSSSGVHRKALESCGIRTEDGGIFFGCNLISNRLLKDTPWRGLNIARILERLPGATRTRKRIDERLFWGVFFRNKGEISGLSGGSIGDEK